MSVTKEATLAALITLLLLFLTFQNWVVESDPVEAIVEAKKPEHITFSRIWPDLKDHLCFNGVPSLHLGEALFSVARYELSFLKNMTKEEERANHVHNFYQFLGAAQMYITADNKTGAVYLALWKAANNQIRVGMRNALQKEKIKVVDLAMYDGKSSAELFSFLRSRRLALKDVCFVTAVRDPVAHFLSGYNEIEYRGGYRSVYAQGNRERFISFVIDFLTKPLPTGFDKAHAYSTVGILTVLARHGLKLTSYLNTTANVETDFPVLLKNACQISFNASTLEKGGQHISSNDPKGTYAAAKAVWKEGGATARALCAIHAIDYACWEDLPGGIPDLCKSVIASPFFVQKISNVTESQETQQLQP